MKKSIHGRRHPATDLTAPSRRGAAGPRAVGRMLLGAGTALALTLGAVSAPSGAHPGGGHARSGADGDVVRAWNEVAVNTLTTMPGPAGGTPFGAAIHMGMVQGAVFDAVNAINRHRYRPYLLDKRFPRRASEDAAVATAAHGVLHHIVSSVPNLPPDIEASTLAALDAEYAASLDDVRDGWREAKGVAAGEAAAEAMIDDRADDGRFGPSPWVPNTAPGHWSPATDPTTGQPVLDPTAWVAGVEPFVVRSPSQFRTPGPLELTSSEYAAELNEVKALGAANSTARTPMQTYIARWWQSTPTRSWNEVGRELAERHDLDALATARLLALQNFSAADASINCWDDKYHWDFWRPANAIHRAAEDGNPATEPDSTWAPLISAPYPEHPSGHLCLDGAHVGILTKHFGDRPPGGFSITSVSTLLQPGDPAVREFHSFSQVLAELVEARIWAGLHFRTADRQGKVLGLRVARYVATHELQPLRCHRGHRWMTQRSRY